MSKFTQGKWEARPNRVIANGRPLAIVNGGNSANTRLIAAAPEMYELLQESYLALQQADANEPLRFAIDECLCRITGEIE